MKMLFMVIGIILLVVGGLWVAYGFTEDETKHKIMGGIIVLVGIASIVYSLSTPGMQKNIKHMVSDTKGLHRVIEQYDYTGKLINKYEGNIMVELISGGVSFIDNGGKEIKLIGGVITVKEE